MKSQLRSHFLDYMTDKLPDDLYRVCGRNVLPSLSEYSKTLRRMVEMERRLNNLHIPLPEVECSVIIPEIELVWRSDHETTMQKELRIIISNDDTIVILAYTKDNQEVCDDFVFHTWSLLKHLWAWKTDDTVADFNRLLIDDFITTNYSRELEKV